MNTTNLNLNERLLNAAQVAELMSASRETVWRWARRGVIPKPVKLHGKWRRSEIIAHIAQLDYAEMKEATT